MKTFIHHIHLNVSDAGKSLPFYKSLLRYLGYKIIDQSRNHIGASNGTTNLWVVQADFNVLKRLFRRKEEGLRHIAFRVSAQKNVEDFAGKYLRKLKINTLYGSPRLFPEYGRGYFAVYFLDPDGVQLEVVYIPRKKLSKKSRKK